MSLAQKDQNQKERLSDPLNIRFYNGSSTEKSHTNLKEENGSFMWYSLLIEILLRKKPEDNDRQELVDFMNEKYQNNFAEISTIVDFAVDYSSNRAIQWYTKNSCFYRLLNQALRTEDYALLATFQPFIKDINSQLTDKYKQEQQRQRSCGNTMFYVYRAQMMSKNELKRIMNARGQIISMNSFLSTSANENVALMYASQDNTGKWESVLLKIKVDGRLKSVKPYADISSLSLMEDEEEVLFSWGTLFRIKSATRNTQKQFCVVDLQLCDENEDSLKDLLTHMKNGVTAETTLIDFAWHLKDIKKYDLSEQFYRKMLTVLKSDDPNLPRCYNGLGGIFLKKGDYDQALKYYQKQYELRLKLHPSDHSSFAPTYSNLGIVYNYKKDYNTALEYYTKALSIYLECNPWGEDHHETAGCYANIGSLFFDMENYESAMFNYRKALNIQKKILCYPHRDLGAIYTLIGQVHFAKNELAEALYYFQESLEIKLQSHPNPKCDHSIKDIYTKMAIIYQRRNENELAAEMNKKASEICE